MTYLGKDEQIVNAQQFTTNLLLAWLKTDFKLTTKRLIGENPNTLLGLIPLGKNEITLPLKSIASVSVSTKFHFKRFFFGGLLAFIGLLFMGSSFVLGLLLLLIGLLPLLNCYTSSIVCTNNAGQNTYVVLSILEKDKAVAFVNRINTTIADTA